MEPTTRHDKRSATVPPGQNVHSQPNGDAPLAAAQLSAAELAANVGELLLACRIAIDVVSKIARALRATPQEAMRIIRAEEWTGLMEAPRR